MQLTWTGATSRALVVAAAAAMALVAGCGGDDTASSGGASSGGGSEAKKIVYVQGQSGNPFFTSVTCGAQDEAKSLGVQFSYQGGKDYSPQSQTPVLNGVIANKPDAILISPMVGKAMIGPLTQAKAQGIDIVFVDTAAQGDLAASFVASDNEQGGRLAAQKLASLVGNKGTVLLEGSTPGISSTDARNKGFMEEIKKFPDIKTLTPQYSNGQPSKATSDVSAQLSAHGDLAGIFAVSTQEVEGAAAAIRNAHKEGEVKLIGFDTAPPILEDVRRGVVQGLVVQEPLTMGAKAIQQAVNALSDKPTEPEIHTPFVFLTKDNMDDPSVSKFIYKTDCA
jgi:ribose transport system substrate-binding protein